MPLHDLHVALGARMVPFAGYDMPLHYPAGIMAEHRHTREARQPVRRVAHGPNPSRRANRRGCCDGGWSGWCRQTSPASRPVASVTRLFTNDNGGIRDDLMVANRGDHLLLVVNAGCKDADEAYLRAA